VTLLGGSVVWTKTSLCQLIKDKLQGYRFIIVSNREPYIHSFSEGQLSVKVPASGLTIALDPVMQACGGTWIAHGSGDADRDVVDALSKVRVPPDNSSNSHYSLKRVWLSKNDEDGYYYGFANEAIWPLCHIVYTRPTFRETDWFTYQKVNQSFANSILEEVGNDKAFVFIQDYHLALLSEILKQHSHNIITAQFWHIPWPNPESFRICPWQKELLSGLLSNDLLGFHIRYNCNNFMDTVEQSLEARVDRSRDEINFNGRKTVVLPFPISVDFEELTADIQKPEVKNEINSLKRRLRLGNEIIGIGIERFDYTKGIPDRLRAIDRFFEKYPEYQNKMVFIQAGVTSRIHIETYQSLNKEIERLVENINWKYKSGSWVPIIFLRETLPPVTLMALRSMADFCIVSPLHDGMNLVAKEFVASRADENGVLILSIFAGASQELTDALLVNPYATDHFAETIHMALEMPEAEKQRRMRRMRAIVQENNVYKWAAEIISYLLKFEFGE
jgi:alpha,alpha-trehalose-phosphate synthase [UDP-forming]